MVERDGSRATETRDRRRSAERRDDESRSKRRTTSRSPEDRRRRRDASVDSRSMTPPAHKRRRRSPTNSETPPRRPRKDSRSPHRDEARKRRSASPQRSSGRNGGSEGLDRRRRDDRDNHRRRSTSRDNDRRREGRRGAGASSPSRQDRNRSPRSEGERGRDDRRKRRDDSPPRRNRGPLPSQLDSFKGDGGVLTARRHGNDKRIGPTDASGKPVEKEQINLRPTGLLATEANTLTYGNQKITLKYHQPPEARKPDPKRAQWRLFIFKGEETLDTIELYEKSCWLVGREKAVADLWVQSPGVSGQHAVLQFRAVDGKGGKKVVKLYVIDLESANGTVLNGEKVPERRYVEVRDRDVLQFGGSGRDYVVMLPSLEETATA